MALLAKDDEQKMQSIKLEEMEMEIGVLRHTNTQVCYMVPSSSKRFASVSKDIRVPHRIKAVTARSERFNSATHQLRQITVEVG